MKNKKTNYKDSLREDLRWAEMVRKAIMGLSAQAEMNSEGCDTNWLAMYYGLENLREIMDAIVDDLTERINEGENEQ